MTIHCNDKKSDRTVPVSAFADIPKHCDHIYKFLRTNEHGNDVFYCEKCLTYKKVFGN